MNSGEVVVFIHYIQSSIHVFIHHIHSRAIAQCFVFVAIGIDSPIPGQPGSSSGTGLAHLRVLRNKCSLCHRVGRDQQEHANQKYCAAFARLFASSTAVADVCPAIDYTCVSSAANRRWIAGPLSSGKTAREAGDLPSSGRPRA